jgi:hypothetical protein
MSDNTLNKALRIMGYNTGPDGDPLYARVSLDRIDPVQR